MRRAVAIESGLFDIQANKLRRRDAAERADKNRLSPFYALIPTLIPNPHDCGQPAIEQDEISKSATPRPFEPCSHFYTCFGDSDAFERLGRYEVRLWRQTVQTILLLNSIARGHTEYADCHDKYLHLRNARRKPPILWPPFVTSD